MLHMCCCKAVFGDVRDSVAEALIKNELIDSFANFCLLML